MVLHFFTLSFSTVVSFFFHLPIRTVGKIRDKLYLGHVDAEPKKQEPQPQPLVVSKLFPKWRTLTGAPTQLFSHRGEKILFPEHTLPGYEVAAILHADFLEPDVVLTKDGHLVCHHDLFLTDSTDVADHPEFEHLRSSFVGRIGHDMYDVQDDWFIKDFTLEQLKKLRVRQSPIGIRPRRFDGLFEIPTFVEFLQLVQELNAKLGRRIGIVPELKYPKFHNGLDNRPPHFMENVFLAAMADFGYPRTQTEVMVQCFEHETLTYIQTLANYETVLLIDTDVRYLTYGGLNEVARMKIGGLGIWKEFLYRGTGAEAETLRYSYDEAEIDSLGGFVPREKLVGEIHRYGMKLAVYTVKDSREMEPVRFGKQKEMEYYFAAGVDAMFVENVAESHSIRENYCWKLANSV